LLLGLGMAMHWLLTLGRGPSGRIKFTDGSAALCMAFIACWLLSLLGFFCSRFWDPTMSWNSFIFRPPPLFFPINIISSCKVMPKVNFRTCLCVLHLKFVSNQSSTRIVFKDTQWDNGTQSSLKIKSGNETPGWGVL
jgi:hypothetical protein